MTVADVGARMRAGRLDDLVREAVAVLAGDLVGAEISVEIGCWLNVAPEVRLRRRNGYRPRAWQMGSGKLSC